MKKLFTLLLFSTLTACGPAEGPLGLHVGDKAKPLITEGLEWISESIFDTSPEERGDEYTVVTRIGRDWVEFDNNNRRLTAQSIEGWLIVCPHEKE